MQRAAVENAAKALLLLKHTPAPVKPKELVKTTMTLRPRPRRRPNYAE